MVKLVFESEQVDCLILKPMADHDTIKIELCYL